MHKTGKSGLMKITWEGASDDNGIARVNLYKDDELLTACFANRRDGDVEIAEPAFLYIPDFQDDEADYRLGIVDVWGNETRTPTFKISPVGNRVEFKPR